MREAYEFGVEGRARARAGVVSALEECSIVYVLGGRGTGANP